MNNLDSLNPLNPLNPYDLIPGNNYYIEHAPHKKLHIDSIHPNKEFSHKAIGIFVTMDEDGNVIFENIKNLLNFKKPSGIVKNISNVYVLNPKDYIFYDLMENKVREKSLKKVINEIISDPYFYDSNFVHKKSSNKGKGGTKKKKYKNKQTRCKVDKNIKEIYK